MHNIVIEQFKKGMRVLDIIKEEYWQDMRFEPLF